MLYRPSPNFDNRRLPLQLVVLHYTGMLTLEGALDRLCDPAAKVSCHYLIARNGDAYTLVEEDKRAWHAGVSSWRGITDINSASLGIELENPGHSNGYLPFSEPQIERLLSLLADIKTRYTLNAADFVGHSDIAPTRKIDPGELFPWERLAKKGFGLWPSVTEVRYNADWEESLRKFGYNTDDLKAATDAFHRHFYAERLGLKEDQESRRRLGELLNNLTYETVMLKFSLPDTF
jgi:N-acetylmuramoyl-L-alanine amidase